MQGELTETRQTTYRDIGIKKLAIYHYGVGIFCKGGNLFESWFLLKT